MLRFHLQSQLFRPGGRPEVRYVGLVREDRKLEMILTWQPPKRKKAEGEDFKLFAPGGSSRVADRKKLFLATFTTSVPLREPVSELWGQFLRPHGSVRPHIKYIILDLILSILYFLIGSYLQSPLQTSRAPMKPTLQNATCGFGFSCRLHVSGLHGLAGFVLSAIVVMRSSP